MTQAVHGTTPGATHGKKRDSHGKRESCRSLQSVSIALRRLLVAGVLSAVAVSMSVPASAQAEQGSSRHPLMSGRIDSGVAHSCAILPNGSLRCWGTSSHGQLGYGNTESIGDNETPASAGPVDLGAGRTAVATASGSFHSCALLDNGTVRCWGQGNLGQLGYGNTNDVGDNETPGSAGPVELGSGRTAVEMSAGEAYSCALLDNGTIRCWGFGTYGELGYGNKNDIGDDESPGSVGPVDLGAGRTAVTLSSGGGDTCAILDNGRMLCWGYGPSGGLGYGSTEHIGDNETPGSVGTLELGAGRTALAVSTAGNHTCVILDTGAVKCWGKGTEGQLGYGNTSDALNASTVGTVDLGAGRTAVAISTGINHTCALLDNGTVRCWGDGIYGQLGYGNMSDVGDNETPGSVGPVDLGAGRTAVALSSGQYFTCALLDNGTVRCWGEGYVGRLGYGNEERIGNDETPASAGPVDLGTGSGVLETAAGRTHTCARFANGTVRCWGEGTNGRLGYASTANVGDQANVGTAGTVNLGGQGAIQIATGEGDTCALFGDGTVRCWGLNNSGQLGYGNTESIGDNETPASVSSVSLGGSAVQIAVGANHNCALLANGTVRCWGLNSSGQLGYGNTESIGDNETPGSVGPVAFGGTAVRISAGGSHTCARLGEGTVRCWGLGTSGRLGYANTTTIGDNEAPSAAGAVGLGGSASLVAAGGSHTCATLANGTVRCWGLNSSGQLGYANTTTIGDNETPAAAGPVDLAGRNAVMVSTGELHTCALTNDHAVRCWGLGTSGRLGYANTTTIGDNETPGSAGAADLGGLSAIDVSAGGSHTCSALANGTVRCWGLNSSGQLGYGNTVSIGDNETPGSAGPVDFVDDPPVAVNDPATITEDASATSVNVLANDTDIDGGPKEVASKTDGTHGSVAITGEGTGLTYTPDANYCGPDAFTYELNGGSAATVSITVTCVDDPPVGVNDSATLAEDSSATVVDVLANDTDIDGGPREVASKTNGTHGTVAITGGGTGLTYTPNANYCGPDSFTYTLNGGSTATVAITITCVDDPPVARQRLRHPRRGRLRNGNRRLGQRHRHRRRSQDSQFENQRNARKRRDHRRRNGPHLHPRCQLLRRRLIHLHAQRGLHRDGLDHAHLRRRSAGRASTTPQPSTRTRAQRRSTSSPTTPTSTAGRGKSPRRPAEPTAASRSRAEAPKSPTPPTPTTAAPTRFTYTLNGGSTATVSITVACVDDPPVAVNDSATLAEDSSATVVDVLANDTDIDGGSKSVASKTNGAHGSVAIVGGGLGVSYTPDANYCGPDSFTYDTERRLSRHCLDHGDLRRRQPHCGQRRSHRQRGRRAQRRSTFSPTTPTSTAAPSRLPRRPTERTEPSRSPAAAPKSPTPPTPTTAAPTASPTR